MNISLMMLFLHVFGATPYGDTRIRQERHLRNRRHGSRARVHQAFLVELSSGISADRVHSNLEKVLHEAFALFLEGLGVNYGDIKVVLAAFSKSTPFVVVCATDINRAARVEGVNYLELGVDAPRLHSTKSNRNLRKRRREEPYLDTVTLRRPERTLPPTAYGVEDLLANINSSLRGLEAQAVFEMDPSTCVDLVTETSPSPSKTHSTPIPSHESSTVPSSVRSIQPAGPPPSSSWIPSTAPTFSLIYSFPPSNSPTASPYPTTPSKEHPSPIPSHVPSAGPSSVPVW